AVCGGPGAGPAASGRCDNPEMGGNDRFEELAATVGGFYRSWVIYLGLELGLFPRIPAAGRHGIETDALAAAAGCQREPVADWVRAAHAGDLLGLDGTRVTIPDDVAADILDATHTPYLSG